jgi:hypothetical protein
VLVGDGTIGRVGVLLGRGAVGVREGVGGAVVGEAEEVALGWPVGLAVAGAIGVTLRVGVGAPGALVLVGVLEARAVPVADGSTVAVLLGSGVTVMPGMMTALVGVSDGWAPPAASVGEALGVTVGRGVAGAVEVGVGGTVTAIGGSTSKIGATVTPWPTLTGVCSRRATSVAWRLPALGFTAAKLMPGGKGW